MDFVQIDPKNSENKLQIKSIHKEKSLKNKQNTSSNSPLNISIILKSERVRDDLPLPVRPQIPTLKKERGND